MKPFFSVIIPTLNEERFLPKILSDLQEQKDKDFEVLVIDSKSTDGTKDKAKEFAKHLPLRFLEVQKQSVSYQRNYGATQAMGAYLLFHDADTRISPLFNQKLKKEILRQKGLLFLFYMQPDRSTSQSRAVLSIINLLVEASQNISKPFSSAGSVAIEKNFFHLIRGYEEKLFIAEDHNLVQKAFQWGVRAKFLRNVKIKYSFRRMRKEGQLKVLYKYLLGTSHILLKGDIKNKIFDYQMGGQLYHNNLKLKSRENRKMI